MQPISPNTGTGTVKIAKVLVGKLKSLEKQDDGNIRKFIGSEEKIRR